MAEAGRHTNRQTDRQAGGRHRQVGRHTDTQTLESDRQTPRQTSRWSGRVRQAHMQASRQ